jgi:hypothetical protein
MWAPASKEELYAAFPGRTWRALRNRASKLGVDRTAAPQSCASDPRDQIRQRSREDGIALLKLGKEIGAMHYFRSRASRSDDFNVIAGAVEFFGGRLVIGWQDE